MRLLYPLIQLV